MFTYYGFAVETTLHEDFGNAFVQKPFYVLKLEATQSDWK